jgi:hypothetical protein
MELFDRTMFSGRSPQPSAAASLVPAGLGFLGKTAKAAAGKDPKPTTDRVMDKRRG